MSVADLVSRLQAKRNGQGWMAKCPAHDDRTPSLSINEGRDGRALLKCHTGCNTDDVLAALGITWRDLFPEPINGNGAASQPRSYTLKEVKREMSQPPFNWRACVEAFTDKHIERLVEWRGYSRETCQWLKENELVGLYEGQLAFPVKDDNDRVIAAHCRAKDGSWRYCPQGCKTHPLIIVDLHPGEHVRCFESQWDAFSFIEISGELSGIIITRGASNGKMVADLVPKGSTVYVLTQNDKPGEKWEKDICANTKALVKRIKVPEGHKDLNDWHRAGATDGDLFNAILNAETLQESPRPLIEFKSPLQLKNYTHPPGLVLVGDCHIVRGSVFVIGGAPGVGKSRASVSVAVAGATGSDWFGLTVPRKFKTMIIQTENGLFRLSKEFGELNCDAFEGYVRICPPPPFGLCFERDEFKAQLSAAIRNFQPDVVIFDPWNAAARDEKARQYLDTFDSIRSVLPLGDNAPALGIVAHTRKPKADERASGRALLNLLAGSYVLGSVPRTVFVMQAASDDTTDNKIVWTCCKNNDGELGQRSAWERRNGLFAPVAEFDWDAFDAPEKDRRETISEADIATVFANGPLTKAEARKLLEETTGASRSACYYALDQEGRFRKHLEYSEGKLTWK
jgi:hypothetical protein